MKFLKLNPRKNKAQAILEFAIALPVLLLLVYGLIETGRLLFIYSSVINASRQAVRWGSTSGIGPNGVPRYQDCQGIRNAAQAGDYLNAFDDNDITITYDYGISPYTAYDTCNGTTDTGVNAHTGDRVKVNITADFNALVPLVPFVSRTVTNGNPIIGTSSRTLLLTISIATQSTATQTVTSSPTFTPSLTPSRTPTASNTPTRTQTLQFTHTPSITSPATATFTRTRTPTPTNAAPTAVTGCNTVTVGLLKDTGGNLSMTINNPLSTALQISDVTVQWNHDKGHQTGSDKTLRLQSASLGGVFWTGNQNGPTYTINPVTATIPASTTSTISFSFHQTFDRWDSTESITINLSTPGCQGVVLYQNQH
ncbi:MAG TPA: hypothetical protein DCX53_14190 [Anaerolineae bacterium]|nr:hypothetical protein [Anaerolineae bacterium]